MKQYTVYLGLSNKHGAIISAREVRDFLYRSYFNNTAHTLTKGTGVWEGEQEEGVIITVVAEENSHSHKALIACCKEYKETYEPDAVMLTTVDCTMELI